MLDSLKGRDLAQVQVCAKICDKLDFNVYLATMEKVVQKGDEEEDDETDRCIYLKKVVKLDGTLMFQKIRIDEDALLYPNEFEEDLPEREEHEGYTGNEGATATYWYRDTVWFFSPFRGIFPSDTIVQVW